MKQIVYALIAAGAIAAPAMAEQMKMAVTTSFQNSGLSDVLLPEIAKDLDLEVQLLVVGTGQAIRLGEGGDVDAILVHSLPAEEAFIEGGYGTHRTEIMYNDFVFIGPASDPAGIADLATRGSGTGPFKFESWDPGIKLVLTANEDYWGSDGPYLDGIEYQVFGDDDALLAELNRALGLMKQNGSLRYILNRWIPVTVEVR